MLKKNKHVKSKKSAKHYIKHKKSKIPFKKIIFSIFVAICIIFLSLILILNIYLNKINKVEITKNNLSINETFSKKENTLDQNYNNPTMQNEENVTKQNNDIKNIALFGIDEVEGIAGRSDCIMILTIDNKNSKLKLSSIMRDSYVTIPTKNKKDKINHAYAFGGPKLALETINENFKLNIDKFVTVNFSSLPKAIDSIGGITLNITDDEIEYINAYIAGCNEENNTNSPNIIYSGNQLVDGTQALAYCRIRNTAGGDIERSHRQRTVLSNLFEKSKTVPITKYPSLLNEILPMIHTNLDKSEILSLTFYLNYLRNNTILQDRFPYDVDGNGKLIDGIYYYVFDEESTAKRINNFIFEKNK